MKKNWGPIVNNMNNEELRHESTMMLNLRKECFKMAIEDLSKYTGMMASILNVTKRVVGCDMPVLTRQDWIESLTHDPSNIQLQKWIFAWMYVRANYKKLVPIMKLPDENFEDKFLTTQGLQYNKAILSKMKKNSKTCVRLLYNVRAQSWKEKMITEIKDQLKIILFVTAPKQFRLFDRNYRREPNTFFKGKIEENKTIWTEVCLTIIV